jgi:nucleotide-binding universal stress UspA family protein
MLKSVLLHLDRAEHAAQMIRVGVELSRQTDARLRGLTLVDTRRARAAYEGETAVYALAEQSRCDRAARGQEAVRGALSQACLEAGLNFDVRRAAGDPLEILPKESQFHDLVITSRAICTADDDAATDLTHEEMLGMLRRGMQPWLIVPAERTHFQRVLLVYDGSESAGSAIRSYLGLEILSGAAHRLLAVAGDAESARLRLREMADYCLHRRPEMETGYVCGDLRCVLPAIAERWDADLIVVGTDRGGTLWGRICGDTVRDLLSAGDFGLFLTA